MQTDQEVAKKREIEKQAQREMLLKQKQQDAERARVALLGIKLQLNNAK